MQIFYRTCKNCKGEIPMKRSMRGSKTCSEPCYKKFIKTTAAYKKKIQKQKSNRLVLKNCEHCGEQYKIKNKVKDRGKYCSDKCSRDAFFEANPGKRMVGERWQEYKKEIGNKLHFVENEFSERKWKYNERIVAYSQSPTGKAFVGLAKGALIPNDNGIGFRGVKIQSENREVAQCYECGNWYRNLGGHITSCHKMKRDEYKEKYGFASSESLLPDVQSNKLAVMLEKRIASGKMKRQKRVSPPKAGKVNKGNTSTPAYQNKKGTCPLQLKEALVNYINRFHRVPSGKSGRDVFSKYMTIERRFGSMNNALKEYGLPTRKKMGGITEFIFPSGEVVYSKNGDNLEHIYYKMKAECPILSMNFNTQL